MNLRAWLYVPLVFALTSASGANFGADSVGSRTLKITALDWEPYTASAMASGGNAIQHLRNILRQCNIELQVEFYPWRRAQQIARQPGYFGYFPAWPIEVHEGFVSSGEITSSHLALMAMADSDVEVRDVDQAFSEHRVGIVKSYVYPQNFQALMQRFPQSIDAGATSEVSLLKMLSMGRFQLAVTDPTVMEYLADRNGIGEVRVAKMLFQVPLVIAMRDEPDNQQNIALIKRLLAAESEPSVQTDLCSVKP